MNKKDFDFYKDFYNKNRISILQYESLRKNFNTMVNNVLGKDYYNMGLDVYQADMLCCRDITTKANMSIMDKICNSVDTIIDKLRKIKKCMLR